MLFNIRLNFIGGFYQSNDYAREKNACNMFANEKIYRFNIMVDSILLNFTSCAKHVGAMPKGLVTRESQLDNTANHVARCARFKAWRAWRTLRRPDWRWWNGAAWLDKRACPYADRHAQRACVELVYESTREKCGISKSAATGYQQFALPKKGIYDVEEFKTNNLADRTTQINSWVTHNSGKCICDRFTVFVQTYVYYEDVID